MLDLQSLSSGALDLTAPLQCRQPGVPVPLTATQRGVWRYISRMGGRTLGNVVNAVRIAGPLDVKLLRECLQMLIERHESLRTRIAAIDDVPHQIIDTASSLELEHLDLSIVAEDQVQAELRRAAEDFAERESDTATGPLFRAALLTASAQEHVLVMSIDHMVCDAASAAILKRELWHAYRQATSGAPLQLPPLPVQFADYAVWQQRTYDAWRAQHGGYWTERLAGVERTVLPADCEVAPSTSRTSASLHIPMGKRLSDALREVARREGVPLLVVVLTAYARTMARWCDRRDLLIALVTHGRQIHPELREMVGCLAGGLHLRIEVGNDSALQLLRRVHREFTASFHHYDFDRVTELLPECGTELSFNWMSSEWLRGSSAREQEMQELRIQPFALKFAWLGKLFVFFTDGPSGISVGVTYRPDLFLPTTLQRFGQHLREFSQALVECSDASTAAAANAHA